MRKLKKMNKKGNIFISIVVAVIIYVFGVLMIPFIADDISTAREGLDCSNAAIYDGTKLQCLMTDVAMPYFILFIFSATIGYLSGRDI